MSTQAIETYWYNGAWHNRRQGERQPLASFDTKEYARAVGRQNAMDHRVEHIVKNEHGGVEERTRYGNPPRPRSSRTSRTPTGNALYAGRG